MSGHSKWATTKHQKAVTDARRGAAFTKIANMITVAAREGGDVEFNFKLRLAVEKAKAASMPKDNIERAIVRGSGKGDGANKLEELTYEAYGPGGSAMIITALTDNKLRTYTDIRAIMNKANGRIAEAGSVMYLFKHSGEIIVSHAPEKSDEVQLIAIDQGADDVESDEGLTRVITAVPDLQKIRQGLLDAGLTVDDAKLQWIAKTPHILSDEDLAKLDRLIELLDELDDVTEVATNVG
ncbi:MAG: YebC/PmpR family DNA-binding transcriptional regulator [Patescibacteria group bacterium]|jgi:YebC/PmpR family DNA-binding regulatory protein